MYLFTAFNQELAGKIREIEFRPNPYGYFDEVNDIIRRTWNLKVTLTSVEEITENPLIADLATEKQKSHLERKGFQPIEQTEIEGNTVV